MHATGPWSEESAPVKANEQDPATRYVPLERSLCSCGAKPRGVVLLVPPEHDLGILLLPYSVCGTSFALLSAALRVGVYP
jgi:hypothetical protein